MFMETVYLEVFNISGFPAVDHWGFVDIALLG